MYFSSTFDRALKLRGWGTVNKSLPTNWTDREKVYSKGEGEGEGEGEGDVEGDEGEGEEEEWMDRGGGG